MVPSVMILIHLASFPPITPLLGVGRGQDELVGGSDFHWAQSLAPAHLPTLEASMASVPQPPLLPSEDRG